MGARLYKRGGVWYCWGYDATGKRWRESTKQHDRKAAEIVAREIARRRALASTKGAPVELRDALVMVGEADERAGRSDAVREILKQKGRQLIAHFGIHCNIRTVTRADLERYADARLADVSRHTIAKEIWTLRRACRVSGVGWSDALMPDLGRIYTPRERWLPWGEYLAMRPHLHPERRDYLDAYVYMGPRRSELHSLAASCIDGERILILGTKTEGARRWIPIAGPIREMLARRASARLVGPLFPFWTNDRRDLALACEKAKIDPVTPNDLRRTFCSWLANAGVSPLVAAKLMGHTSTRMVERVYARLGVEIQTDAVARLPVYKGEPQESDTAEEVDVGEDGKDPQNP